MGPRGAEFSLRDYGGDDVNAGRPLPRDLVPTSTAGSSDLWNCVHAAAFLAYLIIPMSPSAKILCLVVTWSIGATARACPTDAEPRADSTVLTVQLAGQATKSFGNAALAALPQTNLTQRLTVSSSSSNVTDRGVQYSGVLLRDVLTSVGFASAADRSARTRVVEAVASDGYRAVFSWGELYNGSIGEQILVITAQDGKALSAAAGPLALRSLADTRPGPRHVRNLCALIVPAR
jgi:hypothetical protein